MEPLGRMPAIGLLVLAWAQPAAAGYTAAVEGTVLRLVGDKKSDALALRLQAGVPGMLEIDVRDDGRPEAAFDRSLFDQIVIEAGPGNDRVRIDEVNGVFTDTEATSIDGQDGNDALFGGFGAETFLGGAGDDHVHGGNGNDLALLGAGEDVFTWVPGDDNDVVEGQADADVLVFDGSNASESMSIAANGGRVLFFRDVAAVTLDLDDVERIDLRAVGGADTVTVHDLTGTDLVAVDVDLAAASGAGDAVADSVVVTASGGADAIGVTNEKGTLLVSGLHAEVRMAGGESGLDRLGILGGAGDRVAVDGSKKADFVVIAANGAAALVTCDTFPALIDLTGVPELAVDGQGGADTITTSGNVAALVPALELRGGKGNDFILGGNGADVLSGGAGKDVVSGAQGNDVIFLGSGSDRTEWSPGHGSDTIEGESGNDVLVFSASAGNEQLAVFPVGTRVHLTRDIGAIEMDLDGIEALEVSALGGSDTVVVDPLGNTALKRVTVDLAGVLDGDAGDAQADTVVVNGTPLADRIKLRTDPAGVAVAQPGVLLRVLHPDAALDALVVNGLAGTDKITGPVAVLSRMLVTVNDD